MIYFPWILATLYILNWLHRATSLIYIASYDPLANQHVQAGLIKLYSPGSSEMIMYSMYVEAGLCNQQFQQHHHQL